MITGVSFNSSAHAALALYPGLFAEKPKQKENDQWQKKQSKAALRAIKAKQKEHQKNAKAVQSDIKKRRKGQ